MNNDGGFSLELRSNDSYITLYKWATESGFVSSKPETFNVYVYNKKGMWKFVPLFVFKLFHKPKVFADCYPVSMEMNANNEPISMTANVSYKDFIK